MVELTITKAGILILLGFFLGATAALSLSVKTMRQAIQKMREQNDLILKYRAQVAMLKKDIRTHLDTPRHNRQS